jgi:hypothetical protein
VTEFSRLLIAALCVWRLTHLLQAEDGPWDVSIRIRRAAGDGFFGHLMDCFYCLSLWIALPVAWIVHRDAVEMALLWPALSGAAILLERATAPPDRPAPAEFREGEQEGNDGVLRSETGDHRDERSDGGAEAPGAKSQGRSL